MKYPVSIDLRATVLMEFVYRFSFVADSFYSFNGYACFRVDSAYIKMKFLGIQL